MYETVQKITNIPMEFAAMATKRMHPNNEATIADYHYKFQNT